MNIEKFIKKNNLGEVLNIKKLTGGLMHKMFKVETTKGIYAIKVLNPEVMSRNVAYDNFIISESISNLASSHGIPVSNALLLNNNFINKLDDNYYMVFDYIEGRTLTDKEITIEHCKRIGSILADIHAIDYTSLNLDITIKKDEFYVDWASYLTNSNFDSMPYAKTYKDNYQKYYSILKRVVERLNESNKELSICHMDMDPKNVMWDKDGNPIIIDWESARLANPYRELIEVALSWSGFLSNEFDPEKYKAIITEYTKKRPILHNRYSTICGNLIGRFGWLDYNLKRSLGLKSNDPEEMKLASNEVSKTIDEINRYLLLIGTMYEILCDITKKETTTYNNDIKEIIDNNELLKGKSYTLINKGFTNTIYRVDDYVVRICTNKDNETKFLNEIEFYNKNKDNDKIPTVYVTDTTKSIVPYYYQIMERIEGKTLYDIWYKLSNKERKEMVIKIVEILKTFHSIPVESYDFSTYIKNEIESLLAKCQITDEAFTKLLILCDTYFKDNIFGIIHGDLHFDNFIYHDGNLTLLDYEYCMVAPIDYEFRIFELCKDMPWKWASAETDMITVEDDYQDLMKMIIENYPELKNIPYLNERLIIYCIIDLLITYKNTKGEDVLEQVIFKVRKLVK